MAEKKSLWGHEANTPCCALVSMGPGFLRKCPQALPPAREWLPDSQAWEVWTRQKDGAGVGSLHGGGKDIREVPGPTELTTYALACSCPWQAWEVSGVGDLIISLGVGFCHSLQTMSNSESRA